MIEDMRFLLFSIRSVGNSVEGTSAAGFVQPLLDFRPTPEQQRERGRRSNDSQASAALAALM
jgi:hypothetical protein